FFRKEVREKSKSELILLITPHLLMTPGEGKEVTDARMEELSEHPYHKKGDQGFESKVLEDPGEEGGGK
ncbi:MAG: hypothetical protein AAB090_08635, partial [Nitrospirota bacterium]